jgi:ABC-2 type transport system permease protein
MDKILLIIKREYLVRVKKRSFILLTLLTPLIGSSFIAIPAWLATRTEAAKTIAVLDESGQFAGKFKNTEERIFTYTTQPLEAAKKDVLNGKSYALVYIPKNILDDPKSLKIFSKKNVSLSLQNALENTVESEIENVKLLRAGIDRKTLDETKVKVSSSTFNLSEEGEKSGSSGAATAIGYFCAFLVYLTVFIYGAQVMRGVMEEKSNRIVEVVISSVKPFQLMMGKIVGIGLVGLTQFMLWILLTFFISSTVVPAITGKPDPRFRTEQLAQNQRQKEIEKTKQTASAKQDKGFVAEVGDALSTLNIPLIVGCFLFYFLGGYLLYSSLFAAVGSAVDSETDVQQFMFPITIPIIMSIIAAQFVLNNPDGPLAFWMSIIPFTSPIIMMVRIPFGVEAWQLALSMVLLVLGFIGTTWLAGRIYRIGILMYGKKVNYRELSKWVFYRG